MGSRKWEIEIESEYDQFLDIQDEAAVDEALRLGRLKCAYATTTTRSKNIKTGKTLLESQVYPVYRRQSGEKRKKPSEKAIKNLNEKNSRRRFIRLCNINFGPGDLWCTFSLDNDHLPSDPNELKKCVTSYIRKLNRIRKKSGIGNLKYIYILEWEDGKNGIRAHVHMLMSGDMDRDEVEATWKYGKRNQTRRLYHDDDFMITGLATYLSKNPRGTKRWYASRGLKKPDTKPRSFRKMNRSKVEKSVKDINKMRQIFEKAYPGYRFLDSEVYHDGEHAVFYLYVRMIRD